MELAGASSLSHVMNSVELDNAFACFIFGGLFELDHFFSLSLFPLEAKEAMPTLLAVHLGLQRHYWTLTRAGFTPTKGPASTHPEEECQRIKVFGDFNSRRPKSQPPLDWPKRKRIALGAAKGLAYLHDHCNPKIIHRDVKASNILLDEEFEAVVGDFGLAKLMDYKDTHVTTAVRGSIGNIAPEYLSTGKSSEKTDVFGYGVMVLELITGQRAFDLARLANDDGIMLLDWVKGLLKDKLDILVDADLQSNYVDNEVEHVIQVALLCIQDSPNQRPKMSEVVRMLEGDGLAERWDEWQKEEMLCREVNHTHHQYTDWIVESTFNPPPDELSGPR
ncbi:hypothetical protein L1049_014926 [Liquidambar formosana]|uniref:non-specific serine/threonine protein kinase n=1 Tax=Liquidambar formosana TaxID=63359 RepID=A0AAP0RY29_LIQFO